VWLAEHEEKGTQRGKWLIRQESRDREAGNLRVPRMHCFILYSIPSASQIHSSGPSHTERLSWLTDFHIRTRLHQAPTFHLCAQIPFCPHGARERADGMRAHHLPAPFCA
jgi:hypothetical protein